MDSDIGGILRILRKRDAQKNSLFCVLVVGCFEQRIFCKNISK